jgi:hypothetical protein
MSEFMANPQLCRNFGGLQGEIAVSGQLSAVSQKTTKIQRLPAEG